MTACKLDIEKLRRDLANYLDNDCASFVVEDGGQVHPTAAFQLDPTRLLVATAGARRGPLGPIEPYPSVVTTTPPGGVTTTPGDSGR